MYKLRIFRRTDDTPETIELWTDITLVELMELCANLRAESPVFMFTVIAHGEPLFSIH